MRNEPCIRLLRTAALAIVFLFAALHTNLAVAQSAVWQRLIGSWNNDANGDNIEIRENQDILVYSVGQGRITDTVDHSANVLVTGQKDGVDIYCYFYITFTSNDQRTNWRLKSGTNCPNLGTFNRISPPPP